MYMKKVELLSPVGNKEMLIQAVHNGADAVYLSGIKYGARKFAANFTDNELVGAIKYAHLYDVKVYVTINTLIYETEIEDFIDYVKFLYQNQVDAVIVQDVGMIKLIHEVCPNLEIHASTQAHNHNKYGIDFLEKLGVKRVVMAREMSLNEINNIKTPLEKEVFVYGALCVCYSGCCLFSSLNGGRSGNRGECVGSCRLPYQLIKDGEVLNTNGDYPLSMKEQNTLNNLKELLDSNIDSLKIEGRMKSPYYVGYITRIYRTLIDKYYNNEEMIITNEELNNLKKLYNREFTNGFLFKDNHVANIKTPNHQGVEIGKVIKTTNKYIYIKLDKDVLNQEDAIRFKNVNLGMVVNRLYDEKELLKNKIDKNNICLVDNKVGLKENDIVLKTTDKKLIDELSVINQKKIEVSFDVELLIGNKFRASISDGINSIILNGDVVDRAINKEVTHEEIEKLFNRLNDTPFVLKTININKDDNIFINLKSINEMRRNLVSKLIEVRENKKVHEVIVNDTNVNKINNDSNHFKITALVRNEEQLLACIENKVDRIYVTDYDLYKKYKNDNIYYILKRVNMNYQELEWENLLVTEIGGVNKYVNKNNLVGDYFLNITNTSSVNLLNSYGVNNVTLSVELSDENIESIISKCSGCELIVYGRLELMVMKYCPLKEVNGCNHCNKDMIYYLKDSNDKMYPVINNDCMTHILHYKIIDKTNELMKYKNMGICSFRLELFDETKENIEKIVKNIRNVNFE